MSNKCLRVSQAKSARKKAHPEDSATGKHEM